MPVPLGEITDVCAAAATIKEFHCTPFSITVLLSVSIWFVNLHNTQFQTPDRQGQIYVHICAHNLHVISF